jgi:hypothetical protein
LGEFIEAQRHFTHIPRMIDYRFLNKQLGPSYTVGMPHAGYDAAGRA